jgi:hypothetical protein
MVEPAAIFQLAKKLPLTNCPAARTYSPILFPCLPTAKTYLPTSNNSKPRKPVGYQKNFLDTYRPNETWYLPDTLRRQQHKMGKTTEIEEPAGTYSRAILNRLRIDLPGHPDI